MPGRASSARISRAIRPAIMKKPSAQVMYMMPRVLESVVRSRWRKSEPRGAPGRDSGGPAGRRAEGAVSAAVDTATDGDAVEGLASCRLEAGRRIGLVNIGWGLGQGGIAVNGSKGRAIAHYRTDGTMPWTPFETLTVTTADGTRTVDLAAGQELVPLVADAMRDTVADLADAIAAERAPAATGATALRILESTVAAYASAALRRTVDLPLASDGPLHTRGVVGLSEVDLPANSPVRARGLFGLTPIGA